MGDWREKLKEIKRSLVGAAQEPPVASSPTKAPSPGDGRPTENRPLAPRYVCLGLDFGTSSTKAVARLLPSGPAFAIPFEGIASADHPYLAPTRLAVAAGGMLTLSMQNGIGWVEDLKVRLMEAPWQSAPIFAGAAVSARPADLAAGYLALILRNALGWCDKSIRPSLGAAEIAWRMNVGIPARDFDAASIKEAFLIAAVAGWDLAAAGAALDLAQAARSVDLAKDGKLTPRGIGREMIEVVPEVAAGVTTYARSPQRRIGAHLFVDVGATTLDTSMFLLNQSPDGPRYAFLSADVATDLGALRLHRFRADELGRLALARFAACDPLKPIPPTAIECVPPKEDIAALDKRFSERCVIGIGKVVAQAKQKAPKEISVPDGGPAEPIQILLSGGGIRLPLYQDAIQESGRRAAPGGGLGLRVRRFQEAPIPRPSPSDFRAPGLSDDDWQRLGIAYGLSFGFEDIGEFVPPSAISKPPPLPRRDEGERYISKDQM